MEIFSIIEIFSDFLMTEVVFVKHSVNVALVLVMKAPFSIYKDIAAKGFENRILIMENLEKSENFTKKMIIFK